MVIVRINYKDSVKFSRRLLYSVCVRFAGVDIEKTNALRPCPIIKWR